MGELYVSQSGRERKTCIYAVGSIHRKSLTEGELVDRDNEQAAEIKRLQRLIGDAAARMRSDYCCSLDSDTPAQRMAFIECLEATEAKEKSDE